jgi:FeS assembly protein IscX
MQLSWQDREAIARELMQAYPDTDRIALTLDALKGMVTSLPQFQGPAEPPRKIYLEAILWTWMRLAGEMQEAG